MKQPTDRKTRDLFVSANRGPYKKPAGTKCTFGDFIAMRRASHRMTQIEYAASLNVSRRALINAEKLIARPYYSNGGVLYAFARAEFKSWFAMVDAADLWLKNQSVKCATSSMSGASKCAESPIEQSAHLASGEA